VSNTNPTETYFKLSSFHGRTTEILLKVALNTIKQTLFGHLWDKENVFFKTGDLLKKVQFT
jgi:hypothetical protein